MNENAIHGVVKRLRMEDCLEGPHLGNHETQLQIRKWRTHEQPKAITFMGLRKKGKNGGLA